MSVFAACLVVLAAIPAPAGVTVPFTWTPGQIEVAVTVDGTPATFVLDTGSEYSVVSTRLARQLGLSVTPGGVRDFASGVSIGIGPLVLKDQRVMVMPFDNFYARGRQIDGLLGYDVFDRYAVRIDVRSRALTFWEHAEFRPPPVAMTVALTFTGRLPVATGALRLSDDRRLPVRLMVDTGASQSVMLRYPFASTHGLFALARRDTSAPSLASGTRRLVELSAEQLTIATLTFDHPDVLAFTEPAGSAGTTETDGLIGNTLLLRFTLYVDYARKRLFFEPRQVRTGGWELDVGNWSLRTVAEDWQLDAGSRSRNQAQRATDNFFSAAGSCRNWSAISARRCVIAPLSRSPYLARKRSNGTTALAMARWPPAEPISANHRLTNSPALRE